MRFDLVRPCKDCPFRTDVTPYLTQWRAADICEALIDHQQSFTCHKTTVDDDGDEEGLGTRVDGPNAQHCAGAMIMLEKMEQPNQLMRIAERLGMYDASKLDMSSPVFDDDESFIEAQR